MFKYAVLGTVIRNEQVASLIIVFVCGGSEISPTGIMCFRSASQ